MRQLMRRAFSRRQTATASLRAELELLREENLRLRLERQRALDASRGAERIEELRSVLEQADEHDDIWQALAETASLRDSLLAACHEMRLTIAAVERQVSSGMPPQELDRRVIRRRRQDDDPASNGAGEATHGHRSGALNGVPR